MELLIVLIVGLVVGIGIYFGRRFYVNNKTLSSTIPTTNKLVSSTKSSFSNAEEKDINTAYREWVNIYNLLSELNAKISFYQKQMSAAKKIWKKALFKELELKVSECEKEKKKLEDKFKRANYSFHRMSAAFSVSEIRTAFEEIFQTSSVKFFSPFFAGARHFIEKIDDKNYLIFLPCYVVALNTTAGCLNIYTYDLIKTEYGTTTEMVYATAYDDEVASVSWLHERVSGGPDLRYSYNPKTTYVWRGKVTIKVGSIFIEKKFSNRTKARSYKATFNGIINLFNGPYGLSIKEIMCSSSEDKSLTGLMEKTVRQEQERKQREIQIQREIDEAKKSLTIINGVIRWCRGELEKIVIPVGIATAIGDSAFDGQKQLREITIAEGIMSIGDSAFCGCASLRSIIIPKGITSIGEMTFAGCSSLTDITLPDGITSIGRMAFAGCSSLTNITLPEGITSIGDRAFSGCSSLTSITLPDSLTSIEHSAFDCVEKIFLSNLSIWCTFNFIGKYVDWVRYQTKKLYVKNELVVALKIPDGVETLRGTFAVMNDIESVEIPDSVKYIVGAFEKCKNLKKIRIGNGVKSIGSYAFAECDSLEEIVIPENVEEIKEDAFFCCRNLQKVVLLGKKIRIHQDAFAGCIKIRELSTKSKKVSDWGKAFSKCTKLTQIMGLDDLPWADKRYFKHTPWLESQARDEIIVLGSTLCAYYGNKQEYTVSDDIKEIGEGAFEGNHSIEKIILPEGLTKIGGMSFAFCDNLKSIMIPNSVLEIDDDAFFGSKNVCIKCYRGSYASNFRMKHKLAVEYISKQADGPATGGSRGRTVRDGMSGLSDEEKHMIFTMRQERERREREETEASRRDETNKVISAVGNSPIVDCDEKRILTNSIVQRWYKQVVEQASMEYSLYFIDELGNKISNSIPFKSNGVGEKSKVAFELSSTNGFDNSKTYYLLVCDRDGKILGKIPYKINITFSNDFDF